MNIGDAIVTFDYGLQEIVDIAHATFMPDAIVIPLEFWLVSIPAGVLGNHPGRILAADQGILFEYLYVRLGNPFARSPAHGLIGMCGFDRQEPLDQVAQVRLRFARDEEILHARRPLVSLPRRSRRGATPLIGLSW